MPEQPAPPVVPAAAATGRLVHFAGRAGDRNARGMPGAGLLAASLAAALGVEPLRVGRPSPPLAAGWQVELHAAMPDLRRLQAAIGSALAAGSTLTILNRCAAALATLPAVAAARADAVVVWIDAHGDCNVPEHTTSGYLGGMIISGAAGLWESGLGAGLDLANVVLMGARDLDPFERTLVEQGRLRLVPPGPEPARRLREAIGGRPVYVHLDCDALEPGLVPTEYQVPGGLSLPDLHAVAALLAEHDLAGLEVAEFEAEWPDGTPAGPQPLIDALAPLLERWRRGN